MNKNKRIIGALLYVPATIIVRDRQQFAVRTCWELMCHFDLEDSGTSAGKADASGESLYVRR